MLSKIHDFIKNDEENIQSLMKAKERPKEKKQKVAHQCFNFNEMIPKK